MELIGFDEWKFSRQKFQVGNQTLSVFVVAASAVGGDGDEDGEDGEDDCGGRFVFIFR